MENYKLDQIDQFRELNLLDNDNNIKLSEANIEKLKQGGITDEINLENISIDGRPINLKAKLSIYENEKGEANITVHPVFKEHQNSMQLSNEENLYFRNNDIHSKDIITVGTIKDFGNAHYQNDENKQMSYYLTLEKRNGQDVTIWGKDLADAIRMSGKGVGDKIVLENKGTENVLVNVVKRDDNGNEIGSEMKRTNKNLFSISDFDENLHKDLKDKNILFQYDKETKSYKSVPTDKIDLITTINNKIISEEQKEKIKKGQKVQIDEETDVQLSPTKGKSLLSNKSLLIGSILLDGGVSYLMVKLANKALNDKKANEEMYSKGYVEALNKLKGELLQKQAKYPNNVQIERDINIVAGEISKSTAVPKADVSETKDVEKSKTVDLNVNDPDTYQDAKRKKETETATITTKDEEQHVEKTQSVDVEDGETISVGRKR